MSRNLKCNPRRDPKSWLRDNVPSDYQMTDGEMDNIIYLVLKFGCNWQMRECDKQVVLYLFRALPEGKSRTGAGGIQNLIMEAATYGWDHILGKEPGQPLPLKIARFMLPRIAWWWSEFDQQRRSDTKVIGQEEPSPTHH